jgi:hypothetical protein
MMDNVAAFVQGASVSNAPTIVCEATSENQNSNEQAEVRLLCNG